MSKGKNKGRSLVLPTVNVERTNLDRAATAERILFTYDDIVNGVPSVESISDLLADLMHYCQQQDSPECDFDNCLRIARMHFAVEMDEEEHGKE